MKVNASDLSQYVFCPRAIYLSRVLGVKPKPTPEKEKGIVGHAIRKELSLRHGRILRKASSPEDIEPLLEKEFDAVMLEAPAIYRQKLSGIDVDAYFQALRGELAREMKMLAGELTAMVEEMGLKSAVEYATPWKIEYSLSSDLINLSGRVDKVFLRETHVPVEIKTGKTPDRVWEGDRLQVTAYVMLLEEKFGEQIQHGFVEYTQDHSTKPVLATEKTRREVLSIRDDVLEILEGQTPVVCSHGSGRKCESCGFMDECYRI